MQPPPLTIAILAPAGVQMLDVAGPADVFAQANREVRRDHYRVVVVGTAPLAVVASSGQRFLPDRTVLEELDRLDTLLVAGSPDPTDAADLHVIDWLHRHAVGARRVGAIGGGTLLLAGTGLLDGRRVTLRGEAAELAGRRYPALRPEGDVPVLRDGPVYTAAGAAGLELAIALVEDDLGREVALAVASALRVLPGEPADAPPAGRTDDTAAGGRAALKEVQRYVANHPDGDHSVASMAGRAGMSERHFARVFRAETSMTPAEFVETVRVEAARRMLEAGHDNPGRVATRCGYADANGLRRAFLRRTGMTPAEYRRRHAHART